MEPLVARQTWRTLEPLHGMIYFVPEADEEYANVGLVGGDRAGYFASRSAALGEVPVEVVIATFFNFDPSLVRTAMRGVWLSVTPEEMLDARLTAADRALRRALGDDVRSGAMVEAARLARRAAEAACQQLVGRSLFAAHAALEWPTEPHLVLWHAQTLLREYRGDGHVAALVMTDLDGVEALVTHAASGDVPSAVLQQTRAWSDRAWQAAVARLQDRGVIEPGDKLQFTDHGRELRQHIEQLTDLLAAPAYEPLGDEGCERLRALARPWSKAVVGGGLLSR